MSAPSLLRTVLTGMAALALGLLLAACSGAGQGSEPEPGASCSQVVAYDGWLYKLEPVSTPLELGEELAGAAYPDCADSGVDLSAGATTTATTADESVRVWRVVGYDDDYLATGTGDYDLYKRWKPRS